MGSIVTIGGLRDSGSRVAPPAVWTASGEMPVVGGDLSAALVGRPEFHIRLRDLVNSITDLAFADRMRAYASEP